MKKDKKNSKKDEKEENEENGITLLRTFEEIDQSNKAFFTVQAFPGLNLQVTKEIKYGINSSATLSFLPLHFAVVSDEKGKEQLVPNPNRAFHFGIYRPFPLGFASLMAANDGSLGIEGLLTPSPFLAANSSFATNFKEFSFSSSLCVRQPWVSICAHFTTYSLTVPKLLAISAFAGSDSFGLGTRFIPPQIPPKAVINKAESTEKPSYEFLLHSHLDKYKFQFSYTPSMYSARLMSNLNENWSVGLQYVREKAIPIPHMEVSWLFRQGKSTVHSIISTAGVVATDFLRNINENLDLTVCVKLDHIAGDYTCGLSLTYK